MTYEIKKQQTIDQQILESDIEDPTKFSLNQEYNFAKNDLSNKTDEHESDNRLQNFSDYDSDDIVFSKMNDKFPLWYYQPKVVSLYIYTLEI